MMNERQIETSFRPLHPLFRTLTVETDFSQQNTSWARTESTIGRNQKPTSSPHQTLIVVTLIHPTAPNRVRIQLHQHLSMLTRPTPPE